jgi:hypothetical protein
MQRRALLRASDQDREQVAQRLRTAALEGRLTNDELDERLGAAFAARTYGELDELVGDLPAGAALPAKGSPRALGSGGRSRPAARIALRAGLPVVLVLMILAIHTGGVIAAHASQAVGGETVVHAFGLLAAARAAGVAIVGVTFLLVLVAAVGWVLSRPWSAGDA